MPNKNSYACGYTVNGVVASGKRQGSPSRLSPSPRRSRNLRKHRSPPRGSPRRVVQKGGQESSSSSICQKMTIATPRCLCGATVANCITQKCEATLSRNPNALITIDEWRRACLLESDYCRNQQEQREACSIIYDEELINRHNQNKQARHRHK